MRALVAATVLAVFAGPALSADECREFQIAVYLFDSAGRTALEVQSKGTLVARYARCEPCPRKAGVSPERIENFRNSTTVKTSLARSRKQ